MKSNHRLLNTVKLCLDNIFRLIWGTYCVCRFLSVKVCEVKIYRIFFFILSQRACLLMFTEQTAVVHDGNTCLTHSPQRLPHCPCSLTPRGFKYSVWRCTCGPCTGVRLVFLCMCADQSNTSLTMSIMVSLLHFYTAF